MKILRFIECLQNFKKGQVRTIYLKEVNAFDLEVGYNLVNALGFP
jgi:hypothetical protein